jgi:hypothetical protein
MISGSLIQNFFNSEAIIRIARSADPYPAAYPDVYAYADPEAYAYTLPEPAPRRKPKDKPKNTKWQGLQG